LRQMSATAVPASSCLKAKAICSSVYLVFLMASMLLAQGQNLYELRSWFGNLCNIRDLRRPTLQGRYSPKSL
jgi:hypothetical protein